MSMIFGFFIVIAPRMALIAAAIYLPIYILRRAKFGKRRAISHIFSFALVGAVVSILYLTLFVGGGFFTPPTYHLLNLRPFIWISETYAMGWGKMIQQLALNVLMFVPLGFLVPAAIKWAREFSKTVLCSLAFVVAIEVVQYIIGRSADIDDVIMNILGVMVGYGIFQLLRRPIEKLERVRPKI